MQIIYLSLGSNVGDREANLRAAIAALGDAGVCVRRVSSFYETGPVDFLEQPWFLNCAVEGETELKPLELLRALREIEAKMGTEKLVAKGPRLIDMDILLYGEETIDTPELQVPHPRMQLRRILPAPPGGISPAFRPPRWEKTLEQLVDATPDPTTGRRFCSAQAVITLPLPSGWVKT